jgi:hypothetical protein
MACTAHFSLGPNVESHLLRVISEAKLDLIIINIISIFVNAVNERAHTNNREKLTFLRANRSIDRRANVQLVDILEMISGM